MLRTDDVVTEMERDSMYHGKQGLVIKVQLRFWGHPEVTVRFDRELHPYHHLWEDKCQKWIFQVYRPRVLRKDKDWEPEVYANRLFRNRWHSLYVLKEPLNTENPCLVKDCSRNQQKTVWFNIWGSVCSAYVCEECAPKYHGMCGDSFPWR